MPDFGERSRRSSNDLAPTTAAPRGSPPGRGALTAQLGRRSSSGTSAASVQRKSGPSTNPTRAPHQYVDPQVAAWPLVVEDERLTTAAVQRKEAGAKQRNADPLTDALSDDVHEQMRRFCDDKGPEGGCFLDPQHRDRVDTRIAQNVLFAAANWSTALMDARLVRLAEHEAGWNALWEIGFYLAMASATDGAYAGLMFLASSARSVRAIELVSRVVNHADEIKHALVFAAKGLRMPVRVAVNGVAAARGNAEADLLQRLQETPSQWGAALLREYPETTSDYGRILLVGVTDPLEVLTVDHFRREITKLLARYQHQVVEIGSATKGGHDGEIESCAWITPRDGGAPRLARVTRATPDGRRQLTPTVFRGWIDHDMISDAIATWQRAFPGQGIELVTLGQLSDVTAEALAWERKASRDMGFEPTERAEEPQRAYSHEDPAPTKGRP
jgi:hypothetical protein